MRVALTLIRLHALPEELAYELQVALIGAVLARARATVNRRGAGSNSTWGGGSLDYGIALADL
jgi:hypothetical protein